MNDHEGPKHRAPVAPVEEPLASVVSMDARRRSRAQEPAHADPARSDTAADQTAATHEWFPPETPVVSAAHGPATAAAAVPEAVWVASERPTPPVPVLAPAPEQETAPEQASLPTLSRRRALLVVVALLGIAVLVAVGIWALVQR